jgi:uncharacterized flavoprotein (TIGR03862 family)
VSDDETEETLDLAVIGGGVAGLRAAEVAATAGLGVGLFEGMPSVGRKLLVAGKGGLNLTHGEGLACFAGRYRGPGQPAGFWQDTLAGFSPADLRAWAAELGVETFEAGSGRVYPVSLRAAPLLRRWVARLRTLGVRFAVKHRWVSLEPGSPHRLGFANGARVRARAVLLALGGGSWPQTGSDGAWLSILTGLGVRCQPLAPANCGWEHPWPPAVLAAAEGRPIKNIRASAGGTAVDGELLLTRYGLEGGAIYQLGHLLRAMPRPELAIDFKPAHSTGQLAAKLLTVRRDFLAAATRAWRLGEAARAILGRRDWPDAASLAREAKHCVIPLTGPRPLAEAISSAGGVCWSELDSRLMLTRLPGVFVAGEMIDWEAPTGGYLIQGCLATATRAARGAVGMR